MYISQGPVWVPPAGTNGPVDVRARSGEAAGTRRFTTYSSRPARARLRSLTVLHAGPGSADDDVGHDPVATLCSQDSCTLARQKRESVVCVDSTSFSVD